MKTLKSRQQLSLSAFKSDLCTALKEAILCQGWSLSWRGRVEERGAECPADRQQVCLCNPPRSVKQSSFKSRTPAVQQAFYTLLSEIYFLATVHGFDGRKRKESERQWVVTTEGQRKGVGAGGLGGWGELGAHQRDRECWLCILFYLGRWIFRGLDRLHHQKRPFKYEYLVGKAEEPGQPRDYYVVLCYTVCGYGLTMRTTTTAVSPSHKWNAVNSVRLYVIIPYSKFQLPR